MMCAACGDQPTRDSFVTCDSCHNHLLRCLGELPALAGELETTAAKLAVMGDGGGGGHQKRDAYPLPFAPFAADLLERVANEVLGWMNHIAETRGTAPKLTQAGERVSVRVLTTTAASSWLLGHSDAIRLDEAGGEITNAVYWLAEDMRRAIDRHDPGVFVGVCDAPVKVAVIADTIRPEPCAGQLYARTGAATVKCPDCGTRYDVAERMALALAKLDDHLATALEISRGLSTLLRPVTPSMIRKMVYNNQVVSRGASKDGHALFRTGDVIDVLRRRDTA